jgi:hypothetical protein
VYAAEFRYCGRLDATDAEFILEHQE